MPVRRHEPIFVPSRASSYATRHDYGIEDSINRADYLSNAVLQDTYDAASRSRGKDHELLRNLNAAIMSTEQHINPRVAAVSRRVRASTAPPSSRPPPGQQVYHPDNYSQAEAPWRAASVPPAPDARSVRASSQPPPRSKKAQQAYNPPQPLPTANLRAHRPPPLQLSDVLRSIRAKSTESSRRVDFDEEPLYPASSQHRPKLPSKDAGRFAKAKADARSGSLWRSSSIPRDFDRASDYYIKIPDVQARTASRYSYTTSKRFGADSKPPRPLSQLYAPRPATGSSNRSKAAIIGSRMEAADGGRRSARPRSDYAANKLRELKREEVEEGLYYRTPSTSALHASQPPLPKPTDRKAIRDVDGFTKPRNLLSWQYRVESRLSPNDLIYQPSRFIRMREQMKDIHDKMGRQRVLLERYLDSDFKISPNPPQHNSGVSSTATSGDKPVSELRRKLRRTIAKGKNNPDYFRE